MALLEPQPDQAAERLQGVQTLDWEGFLAELTLLCEHFGIGIAGDPTCYVMERDDFGADYRLDDVGRLVRV